ncbi:hypothetical protein Lal_00013854 [Lupinus albus]|nr:hypothetical protein Lal_00013854 [Lupinus albus]
MYNLPDAHGHFGPYGGTFVAETLSHALDELRDAYARYQHDPEFIKEYEYELKHFVGRPSPIYHARRPDRTLRRRTDLPEARRPEPHRRAQGEQRDRPGAAGRRMGKPRVIAETGAGQQVSPPPRLLRATAWNACLHGQRRRAPPGRERLPHEAAGRDGGASGIGSRTLKDALNEAMRDWVTNVATPSTSSARWRARTRIR